LVQKGNDAVVGGGCCILKGPANGMGFANWAKALAMIINCHRLKPVTIYAEETHWALAQMEAHKDFLFRPIVQHRDLVKMRAQHFNEGFVIRVNEVIIAIFIA
jgi:hypothetical protein